MIRPSLKSPAINPRVTTLRPELYVLFFCIIRINAYAGEEKELNSYLKTVSDRPFFAAYSGRRAIGHGTDPFVV